MYYVRAYVSVQAIKARDRIGGSGVQEVGFYLTRTPGNEANLSRCLRNELKESLCPRRPG